MDGVRLCRHHAPPIHNNYFIELLMENGVFFIGLLSDTYDFDAGSLFISASRLGWLSAQIYYHDI